MAEELIEACVQGRELRNLHHGVGLESLAEQAWGIGFRVFGLGYSVEGLGYRVQHLKVVLRV